MKELQHRDDVELSVMKVLQKHLDPTIGFDDVISYANYEINPGSYSSRELFMRDYIYVSFLRKWKGFKNKDINPEWTAFNTWTKSERKCFSTNRRLYSESSSGIYSLAPNVIYDVQRKIAQILGPLDIDKISELCRFGNGATYDLRRGCTHAEKSCRPTVTFDAIPWLCHVLKGDDYMASLVGPFSDLKIVEANRMVMVPKSVKTHRPIAAEPTLNSFIQQGIGRYIRMRLIRFGVNLDDQTINQDYAARAQFDGLSTIDLSSASDTLCINLVKLLLPREWFELLDDVRCKFTEYKGKRFLLSKFSSMGNAYTFELESLIFYTLIQSICNGDVSSVYGDDLIVRDCDFKSTVEILTWAGFTINDGKSFSGGSRFYESCGKHYFDGKEVTPCYQKDVCQKPHDYVRLHNRLIRAGIRLDYREGFRDAAKLVYDNCRRLFGQRSPGVGPMVEYDEYFIKENYVWASPIADRVRVRSAVTITSTERCKEDWQHVAYFARKLRNPGFLNPDRDGQASDSRGSKLLVVEKYHWRSATQ